MSDAATSDLTSEILARCDRLAGFSEVAGNVTRTFLSKPMHQVHEALAGWMREAGMSVRFDAVGNLIGHYAADRPNASLFLIGSHLDTVFDAGKYDGILGVLLGVAAVKSLAGTRLPFGIEVLGFSEEEGVRYRASFLGSKAVCGSFDHELLKRTDAAEISMADAIRDFGLDPDGIDSAAYLPGQVIGYLEAHIEQGPVLESRDLPLGVVDAIVGQSRLWLTFVGKAGHAGTQPMELRHDALAAAAEFVTAVEQHAGRSEGLRATVGVLSVSPGAVNVVPGSARLSLDVRHADDDVREEAVHRLLKFADLIVKRRAMAVHVERAEQHAAVPADIPLTRLLRSAAESLGHAPLTMTSGAGHDAAVMASLAPMAMLFLRSPGGISHHPDESVLKGDVAAALNVMTTFLHRLGGESLFAPRKGSFSRSEKKLS